jgi:uncharacterized protein YgiB involved in biofilm formation
MFQKIIQSEFIKRVPKEEQEELCDTAFNNEFCNFTYIPNEHKTIEMSTLAILYDPTFVKFVPLTMLQKVEENCKKFRDNKNIYDLKAFEKYKKIYGTDITRKDATITENDLIESFAIELTGADRWLGRWNRGKT